MNFNEVVEAEYEEGKEVVQVGAVLDLDVIRPKFEDYKAEATRISGEVTALTVQDDESLNIAVMLGGSAKKINKAIETQRKAIILEPQEFVKGVNGLCKQITDALDKAEAAAKAKIGQYQARVEMERRERERKAREEAAALQKKLDEEVAAANRKAQEEARKAAEEEMRIKREREAEEAKARGAKAAEMKALAEKAERERLEAIRKAEEEAAKNAVQAPQVVSPVVAEAPRVTRTEAGSASQRQVWEFKITDPLKVPREYLLVSDQKIRDAIKQGVRSIEGVEIYQETKTVFRT